ncbi:MAG: hypothetical protein F4Z00_12405 [Acidimicrobiaceae bacterium]|nr:hypothetical protein [Acidimicrobiaceae bacterium]MXZ66329.1 hypothetical protein [Acidimicrobiaceae bacterium]MYF32313.1 hypothetical protein [Acidimicrobiaceae bacterium]MYG77527.1 hypothetical protein [Acidimicrobiaceae bacterium]
MAGDTASDGQDHEPPNGEGDSDGGSADKRALGSDELACKLAYECAWQLCEHAIRTLEAQRTRAVALLSVTLIAAGIAASAFSAGDVAQELGCVGGIGGALFAASSLVVVVSTMVVAWPVKTNMALSPKNIVRNLVEPQPRGRTPAWVYKSLAGNLDDAHAAFTTTLGVRNMFYKWSVGCAPAVLVGAGMVVVDVII